MNYVLYLIGALLGILTGLSGYVPLLSLAEPVASLLVSLLKLVSLPIIFLSVVSAFSGIDDYRQMKPLLFRSLKYTVGTTLVAASVALSLFLLIRPVMATPESLAPPTVESGSLAGYFDTLVGLIPSSFLQPFLDNNITGVMVLALLFGLAVMSLPEEQKRPLHSVFSGLFAAVMQVTQLILRLMPIGVWAFVSLLVGQLTDGSLQWQSLLYYLSCVILANLVQAFIVLPLLLKSKGISPIKAAKAMMPALTVAFFSKSSVAALPAAMKAAEEGLDVDESVSRFTFPLCTTINMNACAGFILITVLFVSMSHGMTYTPLMLLGWIFAATIAAIGNAGVPMGCYFMATAFLATMGVPLNIMGLILPFYTLLDMLETAINVWSDSCVAVVVDQEMREQVVQAEPTPSISVPHTA